MAKRLTDTTIWKQAWYRELPPKLKCLVRYVFDCCEFDGIWHEDYDLASFQIGQKVTWGDLKLVFGDKLIRIAPDKIFLPGFIEFQYGELSENVRPHKAVIKQLLLYGIDPEKLTLSIPLAKGTGTDTDTDKDKNKEKDKDQEKDNQGGVGGFAPDVDAEAPPLDFEAIWQKYPRRVGKTDARERFLRLIKTPEDFAELERAVENYTTECRAKQTEEKYIKHLASFLGTADAPRWRDWVSPEASQSFGANALDWTPEDLA